MAGDVREEPVAIPQRPVDARFSEQIHQAATDYYLYPRVDDRPHFAPGPCADTKAVADVPKIGASTAGPQSLHNEKLYYLFTKHYVEYLTPPEGSAPVGQILVKQAYKATELAKDARVTEGDPSVIERSGRRFMAGDALALFVMMKLDEKTPNTDHGWIYGVTDFDGNVQDAGLIQSCANCHQHAKHDRQFGTTHK